MKGFLCFFLGLAAGAAAGAYVTKFVCEKNAEDRVAQATVEARDYYKEKYKKEEPKIPEDDKKVNAAFTRIYGNQYDTYKGEPVIVDDWTREENPNLETYANEIDEDDFGKEEGYSKYYLDYYSDGNLVDDMGNVVEDPVHLIGGDSLDKLDLETPVVYVRNDVTKTDYEVCYVDSPYEEAGGDKD